MKRNLVNSKTEKLLEIKGYQGPSDFWSILDWLRQDEYDIIVSPMASKETLFEKVYFFEILDNTCPIYTSKEYSDYYDCYEDAIVKILEDYK